MHVFIEALVIFMILVFIPFVGVETVMFGATSYIFENQLDRAYISLSNGGSITAVEQQINDGMREFINTSFNVSVSETNGIYTARLDYHPVTSFMDNYQINSVIK